MIARSHAAWSTCRQVCSPTPPAGLDPDRWQPDDEREPPRRTRGKALSSAATVCLYRPLARPMMALVRTAKRLQSGQLDAYLAYTLIALIAILAGVTALG